MTRNKTDLVGGLALFVCGSAFAAYALMSYDMGVLRRIGSGFYPTALGIILAGLGLVIVVQSFFSEGEKLSFSLRPFLIVGLSIAAFAVLGEKLGMMAAVIGSILVATLAEPRRGLVWRALFAAGMAAATFVIFKLGLNLQMPALTWNL